MITVACAVVLAAALGIAAERRVERADRLGSGCLNLMLYVLVPFVAYVNFAHLQLTLDAGLGLILACCGLAIAGVLAWRLGARLGAHGPVLGSIIVTVIIVNTGYFGLPVCVALLGERALSHAVVYDQVISGPMVYTVGFALGALFGTRGSTSVTGRLKVFLTHNPPLVAVIVGLLVPAAWAPHVLVVAAHWDVDVLIVIGFFAVGVFLASERAEDHAPLLELPDRRVALALLLRFAVNPLFLLAAAGVGFGIPTVYFLQAAMPSGVNSLLIGHAFGLDQRLIATIIVWSTLAALVTATVASLV